MKKDKLIREQRERGGTWQALAGLYAILVAGLVVSAVL